LIGEEDPVWCDAQACGGHAVGQGCGFRGAEHRGGQHEVEHPEDAVVVQVAKEPVGGVGQQRDGNLDAHGAYAIEHDRVDLAAVRAPRSDRCGGAWSVLGGKQVADGGAPLVVGQDADLREGVLGDMVGDLQGSAR
jgi:hypothetical protein